MRQALARAGLARAGLARAVVATSVILVSAACGMPPTDATDPGVDAGARDIADAPAGDTARDARDAPIDGIPPRPTDGPDWMEDGPYPDSPADRIADAPPFEPAGKGLWIWRWSYIGKTPEEAAAIADEAGVGFVLIKSGMDGSYWKEEYNADTIRPFIERGMQVLAWPFINPVDIPRSIDAAIAAAEVPGTSGLVLDVESAWERGDHFADAIALCAGIRARKPDVWLAFTSGGWPSYHPAFPHAAFDTYCGDAFFPQIYWADRNMDWKKSVDEAMAGIAGAGIRAPIWPVQSNDDVPGLGGGPSTADLNAFFDAMGPRSSLWEFPNPDEPKKLEQLKSLHFPN